MDTQVPSRYENSGDNTPDETDNNDLFHGYADATFANTDDHKSTTGYIFLGLEGEIMWKSKKQTTIMLSSKEAEYVALSEAGCKATWLRNLYGELGFPQINPTIIKGNNDGSIVLTHNLQFHQQSKHIALHHHWVQDLTKYSIYKTVATWNKQQMY